MKYKNKIILTIVIISFLISGIIAEVSISNFLNEMEMKKEYRDFLLQKSPQLKITCYEEYCLWDATQEGFFTLKFP